jgi:hypothetical protein
MSAGCDANLLLICRFGFDCFRCALDDAFNHLLLGFLTFLPTIHQRCDQCVDFAGDELGVDGLNVVE